VEHQTIARYAAFLQTAKIFSIRAYRATLLASPQGWTYRRVEKIFFNPSSTTCHRNRRRTATAWAVAARVHAPDRAVESLFEGAGVDRLSTPTPSTNAAR